MNQFKAFCASASHAKTIEAANFINGVALGAQGSEKGIRDTVKSLTDGK